MASLNFLKRLGKRNVQAGWNRRDLLRTGGSLLTVAGAVPATSAAAATASTAAAAPSTMAKAGSIYTSLGVKPVVNARGTFTIITGSQSLPQVKVAMEAASHNYVQMDELMMGVSHKLVELTGAPWGIITGGCCAAVTHTTAACIAGTNPERMQRLPDLTGLKSEVIIPDYSRNVYDHAIRMLGVKVVEVNDPAKLEDAFNEKTAMVYILAGPGDEGPLGTAAICAVAKKHNVPVIVDAAAEILTFPNVHLQRGASAVAYSGGKCIRGPQAAGLLLGDKNLLQAAWFNAAPHHAFGRSLKVGKEEIMGMLAAVEAWKTRDHDAEWKEWQTRLSTVSNRIGKVPGVTCQVKDPEGLSNRTPSLHIQWNATEVGITGTEVAKFLLDTEPRIVLGSGTGIRPDKMDSSITVVPYMLMPGEDKLVADRIHAALTNHPKFEAPVIPSGEPGAIAGQWKTTLTFDRGTADHILIFEQHGNDLVGTHEGEYVTGDLTGTVQGNEVRFRSFQKIQGQRLGYQFTGKLEGDQLAGTIDMGEYGPATWTAVRHEYRVPGGPPKPVKSAG